MTKKTGWLPRLALSLSAAAAVLVPLHLLRFGEPPQSRGTYWILSRRPLYHVETVGGTLWAVPNPWTVVTSSDYPKSFPVAKPAGTLRIFCIGQSTTEGAPFQPEAGYPKWLSEILADVVPGEKIEVIDAGVSGSDSFRDLPIVQEVMGYHPDLLVLYEGNNEGIQPQLRLIQERMGNGFGRFVYWIGDYFPLIRRIAASLHFRRPGDAVLMALYKRNVRAMIELARTQHVPVVLLGQVNWAILANPMAASPHNQFLRSQQEPDVSFVDARRIFLRKRACPNVVPDCLLDFAHPSLHGEWLMALALARGIAKRGWFASSVRWRWSKLKTEDAYRKELKLSRDFLAKAYINEAWSVYSDPAHIANMYYDVSEAERMEKGIIIQMASEQRGWRFHPALIRAVLHYYDQTDPAAGAKFEGILRARGDAAP
ncbi:MAG: SGNH/GDSL hydrolase family protein [Elusimicrobia bacterium]|nr:SGNH/GDSL hydrolase family protein [Elusimicrobiota bacterium]